MQQNIMLVYNFVSLAVVFCSTKRKGVMILCVGALGSGKSTLLKILQQHGIDLDAGDEEVLTGPSATGTIGL